MTKKKYLAELQELKSLFEFCLPVGEHKDKAEEYFNSLERIICTNDYERNPEPIPRERFPSTEPDVQYTYLSDAVFKERSSNSKQRIHGQDLGDQPDVYEGQVPQLGGPITADPPLISECQGAQDTQYRDQDSDDPSW